MNLRSVSMRISLGLVLIFASILNISFSQRCYENIVRKEIRSLNSNEWSVYESTINLLHRKGILEKFAYIHAEYFKYVHGTREFLPWHRKFVLEFENVARSYNPEYVQPYWDVSIDFSNPTLSPVFSPSRMGGNGVGDNRCIRTGMQSGWINVYPDDKCLRRSFNNGDTINPFLSPESISSDIQISKNFEEFAKRIETGIHNQVHDAIGGDMDGKQSPLDGIFMLHHANIDRIWWMFQNVRDSNMMSYSGDLLEEIKYYNNSVESLMKIGEGDLCYDYQFSGYVNKSKVKDGISNTDLDRILKIPEMSLINGLSKKNLKRFFPTLFSGYADKNSLDMTDYISKKAIKYSKFRLNITGANKDLVVFEKNRTNVSYNSKIQESLISYSKNRKFGYSLKSKIEWKPRMPYPSMASKEMVLNHRLDPIFYKEYYKEKYALVDALNADGYVSPYI
ncbi:Tyrosinase [Smittium mucronatum]|uniref:Tyrosinase n=1 Tax=Smittium mucronatum TaxID=133383 RepID=A0A1R0H5V9_9FUNG|nr:Tyrosinase [Smittium mucronatum]